MSLWRDVGDLLEMYATGGLVIQTGLDCVAVETAVPDLTLYDGKTYTQKRHPHHHPVRFRLRNHPDPRDFDPPGNLAMSPDAD
ncbi:MAG: hypothetical protein M5U34_31740 [Chloroflexi bacterium]|nr:hypothetical protein [Chloroflexota bacterium]